MGTHAFKAPTGARFSKHLGVCYGYNPQTADVTWYTDAHEKLYLKNLRMYSIYYHVTSKSGLQGWIWKGYMKPANGTTSNPGNSNSGSATGNNSNTTNYSTKANDFNRNDATAFAKQIIKLAPGLVEDQKLDNLAAYSLGLDKIYDRDEQQQLFTKRLVQLYGGQPQGLRQDWGFVTKPDISLVKKQLSFHLNDIDFSNLSKYAGYHIGVATNAWSPYTNGTIKEVKYDVYIVPANPTISN